MQQEEVIKIGCVVFRNIVKQKLPYSCSIEEQLENRMYWHLYSKKYVKEQWSQIMPLIKQIQTKEMQLSDNQHPYILKEISHISFPHLINLSLISNHIMSIECLSKTNMPQLEHLHLCRNQITRMRAMRKADWPKLRVIILNDNPLTDVSLTMSQCNFKNLQFVIIEGWQDSPAFMVDIANIVKMQSSVLKYINLNSGERIEQKEVNKQIEQKYPKIKINLKEQD